MILYKSTGILKYSYKQDYGYKLVLEICQDLADYYRWFIPKYYPNERQRYNAHITVVRKELPVNLEFWDKYEGEKVEFFYNPEIHRGKIYFWINILCKRLEEIRIELGLPISSLYTRPPEGYSKFFHCTIANEKNIVNSDEKSWASLSMKRWQKTRSFLEAPEGSWDEID